MKRRVLLAPRFQINNNTLTTLWSKPRTLLLLHSNFSTKYNPKLSTLTLITKPCKSWTKFLREATINKSHANSV